MFDTYWSLCIAKWAVRSCMKSVGKAGLCDLVLLEHGWFGSFFFFLRSPWLQKFLTGTSVMTGFFFQSNPKGRGSFIVLFYRAVCPCLLPSLSCPSISRSAAVIATPLGHLLLLESSRQEVCAVAFTFQSFMKLCSDFAWMGKTEHVLVEGASW